MAKEQNKQKGAAITEYALTVTVIAALAIFLIKLSFSSLWQEWLNRLLSAVLVKAASFSELTELISYLKAW